VNYSAPSSAVATEKARAFREMSEAAVGFVARVENTQIRRPNSPQLTEAAERLLHDLLGSSLFTQVEIASLLGIHQSAVAYHARKIATARAIST
jgi:DNA-binding CsgD family transcriptional regulator